VPLDLSHRRKHKYLPRRWAGYRITTLRAGSCLEIPLVLPGWSKIRND
jgi:hypothetical protein